MTERGCARLFEQRTAAKFVAAIAGSPNNASARLGMKTQKSRTASRNRAKVSGDASASKKQRTSVGNAKGRSQRSVANAEKRATGSSAVARAVGVDQMNAGPRSKRMHPARARKNQGTR